MNLREQIEKEITEKVMTKLASEKVELGIVDGIERSIDKIYDDILRADSILQKGGIEAENITKNAQLKVESAMDSVKKAEDMAKDLGVNIPQIKELKNKLSSADKKAKEINKRASVAAK